MRIGQLARKYTINQDEVILYLNEVQADLGPFHHNSKVSSDIEELVISHFSLSPIVVKETIEEQSEDLPVEVEAEEINEPPLDIAEIDNDEKTEADLQQELDPTLRPIQSPMIEKVDEKSIDTDSLLELLENDETSTDLSEITHIKASKKELSGLKVVGKIELSEPKVDSPVKEEHNDAKPILKKPNKKQGLSEEERDKRRQRIKIQKEQYEAKQAKRRAFEENQKRKAKNKAHYQEKIQKAKASQARHKMPKEQVVLEETSQHPAAKPIGIFDWFWKLFGL